METWPEPLVSGFVFTFGLILGSFLNVCIHRLPLGESLVRPGSRCPACGTPIRWYQNLPVLSWLALRGRCSACSSSVSWRYPAVELLCGLLILFLWRILGASAGFLVTVPFAMGLVVLFFTDLEHQLLPDMVTLPGFLLGMALAWFNPFLGDGDWSRVWRSGAGAALGAGALWGIGTLYSRLRVVEAMGMGDVKMMAMVGAFAGPQGVAFTIFAGSLAGAVVGVLLIPLRGRTLRDTLPFGCFLAPSAFAALLIGRRVIHAYLGLLGGGH